jgi:hypothetical protein
MPDDNRLTDAEREREALLDQYITAHETPGIPAARLYHRLRRAHQAVKRERQASKETA